jgi:DNA ligase-1
MELLRKTISALPKSSQQVAVVEQTLCKDRAHLHSELDFVLSLGGEGVMLRRPKSKYEGLRSSTLLKLKTFYDAEARVIGHEAGKGRLAGSTGSLIVQMASGKKFKVGSGMSDKEREKPPPVGTIVSYSFQELTKDGVPRFPSYRGSLFVLSCCFFLTSRQPGIAIDKSEPKDAEIRVVAAEDADDEEQYEDEEADE